LSQPYKTRMGALRVAFGCKPQEDLAPTIPKSLQGVSAPSRSLTTYNIGGRRGGCGLGSGSGVVLASCLSVKQQLPPQRSTPTTMQNTFARPKQHTEALVRTDSMLHE
jgi:hypothetical protein